MLTYASVVWPSGHLEGEAEVSSLGYPGLTASEFPEKLSPGHHQLSDLGWDPGICF